MTRTPVLQFTVVAILFLALGAARPASATPIWSGLMGLWSFNGNGLDSSGHGNNLTLNGGASFGPGLFGQGLVLNGVEGTSASMTSSNPAFNFTSGDFTVLVWAKFNTEPREQNLIEKFSGCCGPGWTLTTPGGGDIQFYSSAIILNYFTSIPQNSWQQFVIERNGSTFNLFWDGNLIASGTSGASLAPSPNPLLFGARNSGDGRNFTVNGTLDDVAIWDRALNTSEIDGLWNNGSGSPVVTPEPSSLLLLGTGLLGLGPFIRRFARMKVLSTHIR